MLILTRKLGETIRIGNEIKVTILDAKGRQIRIGIEAPADVTIHREEIYQMIREQNVLAAEGGRDDAIRKDLSHLWEKLRSTEEERA